MMRKVYFLLLMVIASLQGFAAEQPRLTADAPDVVVSGDQFRLVFTVNSQDIKDFRAPSISGFDVLMGPSRSQQSNIQIINGKRTSSSSTAFTYILMAGKEGTYTIPAASIEVDGKRYSQMQSKSRCFRQTRPAIPEVTMGEVLPRLQGGRWQEAA